MRLFDLFTRRPSLSDGLAQMAETPNAVLLDVRTREEYAAGHVPGAKNHPLDALADMSQKRDRILFTYCHSGARSAQACAQLMRQGYQAVNLGGLIGYRGPLEFGSDNT